MTVRKPTQMETRFKKAISDMVILACLLALSLVLLVEHAGHTGLWPDKAEPCADIPIVLLF